MKELCLACDGWREERIKRLTKLADDGVKFLMFDFPGWTGPCYAPVHGHEVPSTTIEHVDTIYSISREVRRKHPDVRIEMHDGIWPWGCRYLPSYFRQGLKTDAKQ